MANKPVLIYGSFNGDNVATFGTQEGNWVYFKMRDDYRLDPIRTRNDGGSWVEKSMDYYQSQKWVGVSGFKLSTLLYDTNQNTGTATSQMVENAVVWAIGIANDDSHGYDWDERTGPNDYDCSGLVNSAFAQAGFDVTPSWTTLDMREGYRAAGFTVLGPEIANNMGALRRGDILLQDEYHTAIYIGNGQQVAAHINENGEVTGGEPGDQTGYEICVSGYEVYQYPSAGVYGWSCVLRYEASDDVPAGEWHENATFTSYEIGGVTGWDGNPIEVDSMGVAVPWNHGAVPPNPEFPELYYGQLLQIKVGNFYGIVLVNDCGNFGDSNDYNHEAVLDLQPGVWAAAGGGMTTYTGCSWRVVGHIENDNTGGKGPWYII